LLPGKTISAPVCMLRARGSPSFHSHLPSHRGGWRADKAQCPDCSRRTSGSGRTMVHGGAPAPCGAPTGIFGLRLVNARTSQELFVPGGLSPSVARGPVCVIADPQVPSRSPPCERLRKAPSNLGSGRTTRRVKTQEVKRYSLSGPRRPPAPRPLDHDPIKLNRNHRLAFCLSMIFFRKPVPTFRDHALASLILLNCTST